MVTVRLSLLGRSKVQSNRKLKPIITFRECILTRVVKMIAGNKIVACSRKEMRLQTWQKLLENFIDPLICRIANVTLVCRLRLAVQVGTMSVGCLLKVVQYPSLLRLIPINSLQFLQTSPINL